MQIVLPIIIPLLTAALALLAGDRLTMRRVLGVAGAGGQLLAAWRLFATVETAGVQVVQIGDWHAPYGISLVADRLSGVMVLVTGVIGLSATIYSLVDIDQRRQRHGYFMLLNVLLAAVAAAFLAGDLFNLYVWFEVMLISSFVLLALGGERPQLEGAVKYVTLNLVSSFIFLTAIGMLYGTVGTLNMADAAQKLEQLDNPNLATTLAMLLLVTLGIKSAIFPLFFWLPASYHTPPAAVAAVFAGLLTKVGVYCLIRVFTLLFPPEVAVGHQLILVLAGLTMLTGVLGAMVQYDLRRILSFHIISQIGYMIFGLGLFTPLALAGAVFYIVHHIVVKTNLFFIAGIVDALRGTYSLESLGGLYRERPWLTFLFAVPALSLAGLPPLSGFVAKLILVQAGLAAGQYALVAVALAVSLLTLYSMAKIFRDAFWTPRDQDAAGVEPRETEGNRDAPAGVQLAVRFLPVTGLAILTILLGVHAEWLFTVAQAAAQELLDSERYIRAVLGEGV